MSAACATASNPAQKESEPLSLPKTSRLLRSAEFKEIYQTGIRVTGRYFAAFCLRRPAADAQSAKIGFTIPRAVGKAVVRNRIRRRMREVTGAQIAQLAHPWAIVFNPRRSVLDAPFEDLCRETARVIAKCNERS